MKKRVKQFLKKIKCSSASTAKSQSKLSQIQKVILKHASPYHSIPVDDVNSRSTFTHLSKKLHSLVFNSDIERDWRRHRLVVEVLRLKGCSQQMWHLYRQRIRNPNSNIDLAFSPSLSFDEYLFRSILIPSNLTYSIKAFKTSAEHSNYHAERPSSKRRTKSLANLKDSFECIHCQKIPVKRCPIVG